ncbi:MAG: alkene reductase [Phycisphaerales bacterium]
MFSPLTLGEIEVPNRILMAPLTRSRALEPGNVPHALNATYYRQRASAGLIVSEATQVSPHGRGYPYTPGIHSAEQIAGWSRVTEAVHAEGGRIFLQLWHVGRISHVDLLGGAPPVAPSAIRADAQTLLSRETGPVPVSEPRALDADEIPGIIEAFRDGARNAMSAGFDGVEIHGANGYLIDQFTRDGSNQRTDDWGGSLANRLRLPLALAEAVADEVGAGRTGYRISPTGSFGDISDSNPGATFTALSEGLSELDLAYLHVVESFAGSERDDAIIAPIRRAFAGAYIANGGYDQDLATARLTADHCDAVAFGTLFISNPDLPRRMRLGAPLNAADPSTYYGAGPEGYADHAAMTEAEIRRAEGT